MNYENQNNRENNEQSSPNPWDMKDAPAFKKEGAADKFIELKQKRLENLRAKEPNIQLNNKLIENIPSSITVSSVGEQSIKYQDANGVERVGSNYPKLFKQYGLGNPMEEFSSPAVAEAFGKMVQYVINVDASQGKMLDREGEDERCRQIVEDYIEKTNLSEADRNIDERYRVILTQHGNAFNKVLMRSEEARLKKELAESGVSIAESRPEPAAPERPDHPDRESSPSEKEAIDVANLLGVERRLSSDKRRTELIRIRNQEPVIRSNNKLVKEVPYSYRVLSVGENSLTYQAPDGTTRIGSKYPELFKQNGLSDPEEAFRYNTFLAEALKNLISLTITVDASKGEVLKQAGADAKCNEVITKLSHLCEDAGYFDDHDKEKAQKYIDIMRANGNALDLIRSHAAAAEIKDAEKNDQAEKELQDLSAEVQNMLGECEKLIDEAAPIREKTYEEAKANGIYVNWKELSQLEVGYRVIMRKYKENYRDRLNDSLNQMKNLLSKSESLLSNEQRQSYHDTYAEQLRKSERAEKLLNDDSLVDSMTTMIYNKIRV